MGAMVGQATIQRILGMLTTIVLVRVLGSAGFGIYSIVVNTASSAYGLVRLGIDAAIHVHAAEHHSGTEAKTAKEQMLGAGLILLTAAGTAGAAICLLFAQWIAEVIYGRAELAQWVRLAAVLVFIQCASQFVYTLLVGLHRFGGYAKVMVLSAAASAVVLSASSALWGLRGAVGGLILVQAVTLWMLWGQARTAITAERISIRFGRFATSAAPLLKNGFPFYASGLASVPSTYYVQGLVAQNFGLEAIGGLRVIVSLTTLVSFIPTAIAAVFVSQLTRSSTVDYTDFVRTSLLNIKYLWTFLLLAGAGLLTLLPPLLTLLFGEAYRELTAPASLAILAVILSSLLGYVGSLAFSRKRVGFIFWYTTIQVAGFLLVSSTLVPEYGLPAYFLAEFVGFGCALCYVWIATATWRRRHVVSPSWVPKLLTLSGGYGLMFLLGSLLGSDAIRSGIGLVCMVAVASVAYWTIFDASERAALGAFLRSRLARPTA